jgi:hypothetical protein
MDGERVGELKGVRVAGQYSSVTGYGLLIGRNTGTPVSHEYKALFAFASKLDKVTTDLKYRVAPTSYVSFHRILQIC